MSLNSSAFDDPAPPPHFFSNASSARLVECFRSRTSIFIFSSLAITNVLLFPLPVLVLCSGYRRWKKQRLGGAAVTSHSDVITYHNIFMQLNEFLGFLFFFCGVYNDLGEMSSAGTSMLAFGQLGEVQFHLLTCVERYLAVLHPVTYRGLRQASGVRIRNIGIGCVWFLSCGWAAVTGLGSNELISLLYYCIWGFLFIGISFCSISVLCALKRPGPRDVGGNRERVDQSKQKAFHTITAIMGVLLIRFLGNLMTNVMYSSSLLTSSTVCLVFLSAFWFDLPNSFVLPLLFLHRAGKLL